MIIFFHIPKCAGQSVNLMIDHAIRMRAQRYHAPKSLVWDLAEDPIAFCERALDADYVTGHISLDMMDYIRSRVPAYTFTILRQPAERLLSNIKYLQEQGIGPAFGLSHLPIRDLVNIAFRDRASKWAKPLANACTRMLSGSISPEFFVGGDGTHFVERAQRTLLSFNYVGQFQDLKKAISRVLCDNDLLPPSEIAHVNTTASGQEGSDLNIANRFGDCLHMDEALWRSRARYDLA